MAQSVDFKVLRNAKVELKIGLDKEGFVQLGIIIENQYFHEFPSSSRESRMIETTEQKVLESHFNGGTYFIVAEKLRDYRPSSYNGHVQTDDALSSLAEIIGIETFNESKYKDPVRGLFNQIRGKRSNDVFLGGTWDKFNLDVESLGIGGEFENQLVYRYSPFSKNIQTSFEVKRLVCENGMIANAPFVTFEVPVIDDWENNLQVVSAQLQPKINDILRSRFEDMADPKSRASVATVERVHEIVNSRMKSFEESGEVADSYKLDKYSKLTDINENLSSFYTESALGHKKSKARLDSHLTQFDVFNILTEVGSHVGREEDTDFKATKELNRIVFDDFGGKKKIKPEIPISQDSDHRRKFFGID